MDVVGEGNRLPLKPVDVANGALTGGWYLRAMINASAFAGVLVVLCTAPALADAPAFVPGRPGATETAVSVPKGMLQVETEIAGLTRDKSAGVTTRDLSVATTSFRYGVAHGADVELIVTPYQQERVAGAATADGFGDVTVRARRTLLGEDGDGPTLGVVGYVTLPTASEGLGVNDVEGGLIVTGAFDLTQKLNLAWTGGVSAVSTDDGGYDTDTSGALTLGRSFTDRFAGYIEVGADHASDTAVFYGAGMTWLSSATTQFDVGFDAGANDAADDLNVFVGWAHRF